MGNTYPPKIERIERNRQIRWRLGKFTAIRDGNQLTEVVYQVGKVQSRTLSRFSIEDLEDLAEIARAAAVNAGGSKLAGKSLIDGLWEELDGICDRIFSGVEDTGDRDRADQMAWVIAYFTNPYRVEREDVVAIKKQAKARWEEQNDG